MREVFGEINEHVKVDSAIAEVQYAMLQESKYKVAITKEQYDAFVKSLAEKMLTIKCHDYSDLAYLQVGHSSSYDPPRIVDEAMKEAGITFPSFGLFPYKSEMHLYENGHVLVDGKVIRTNLEFAHYEYDDAFDYAPFMKITGNKFRIVEIPASMAENAIFTGHIVSFPEKLKLENLNSIFEGKNPKPAPKVYTAVHLRDVTKSEEEFLKLSNEDWIAILQDPKRINETFKHDAYVYYRKDKSEILKNTSYGHIGDVTVETIADNYYQH